MDNKIQELTEKIFNEGVEKGRSEAERLVAEANDKAAEIVKAKSLNFVILIPTDSAAILSSRIAITARPVLECTRFKTIIRVITTKTTPIVNVESLGAFVRP